MTTAHTQTIDIGHLLDDGHWGRRQKLFVFLTALTIVFDGVDNQLLGIAVPAMMRDWAVPRGAFRAVLASGMIGMMIGGALAGLIGDRMGRRFALIGSVLIFGILTAAVALVESLWALGALRFLAGLGLGGAMPNAAALASEYVPRRYRPFAITLTIVCVPLGGTLAALVAGYVMPIFGWRSLFALGGMLPLVVAAVLMRFLPESPRYLARHPERWPELERILRQVGHTVPAGSTFVDLGEKATPPRVGRRAVHARLPPRHRRALGRDVRVHARRLHRVQLGAGDARGSRARAVGRQQRHRRVQSRRRRRRSLRRTGHRAHRLEAHHALDRGRGRRRRRGAWP